MSKSGEEATSSEGSPTEKPKPRIPAKARPINLVPHSPWSARENSPQDLGYAVRKLVRTTQSPEVAKQDDREVASYSTSTRKLVRTATPWTEFSKHEVREPSVHDEDLPFLTKEVGNCSRLLEIFQWKH